MVRLKLHWLLLSALSALLWAWPAEAGRLLFWRFENNRSFLTFTTDDRVQPKAQLIFNPSRVVIDLPGITLGRPTSTQSVGGLVKSVRVGQFDSQTTRIVIELAPGYTVDPQQVKIRGLSPTHWTVELPPPQKEKQAQPLPSPAPSPSSLSPARPSETADFQVTRNGLYVRLERNGEPGKIASKRSRDGRSVEFSLPGAVLPESLRSQRLPVNEYQVGAIQLEQAPGPPAAARLLLEVREGSPEWQAVYSRLGGIVLLPRGGASKLARLAASGPPPSSPPPARKATITAVELAEGDTQLLIRSDGTVISQGKWNRQSGYYEIRLDNAQLAPAIRGPQLQRQSPIYQLRIRQEGPQTVAILLRPSLGAQFGELQQVGQGLLTLSLGQGSSPRGTISQGPARQPEPISVPLPASAPSQLPAPTSLPPNLPRPSRGRNLVVVDPGHGGKDPGAIGLNGLQEKDVILPISLDVSRLLQQQGVEVMLTRTADYFVGLQGRADLANRARADLFVSIHANAVGKGRSEVNGLEVYYYGDRRLADAIHRNILRGVNVGDRGVKRARFYVLRQSTMPSALVEVGFLTGYADAPKLGDPAYRRQMAEAIARGILEYIQQNSY